MAQYFPAFLLKVILVQKNLTLACYNYLSRERNLYKH